jgi:hypothetical protein
MSNFEDIYPISFSKPDVKISRDLADELLDGLIELRNSVSETHTRYDKIIEDYQNVTDKLESAILESVIR